MNGAGDDDFFCGGVDVAAAKQTIRQALRGQRGLAPMHEDYDGDDDSLVSLLIRLSRRWTPLMR